MLLFPASYTATRGLVTNVATEYSNVFYELAFPLVLGDNLQPTAQGYVHHTTALNKYDHIFGLQIAIMCLEDPSLGAIYVRPSKLHQRGLYEATVKAIARLKIGIATATEKELIKKNTVSCAYFSAEHQQDIKAAIEKERAKAAEQKKKKRRKKADDDDEEEEEKEQEQEQEERAQTVDILNDPRFDVQRFINLDIDAGTCEGGKMPHLGQDAVAEADQEEEEEELNLFESFKETTPKTLFTLTPIYKDRNVLASKVGYLVRVLIFDPTLNVGDFVARLIHVRGERAANKYMAGKDPFMVYAEYFSSGLHPVNTITRERYIQVRNSICNEQPDFAASNLLSSAPEFGNYKNPLHPCNIWTLERALAKLTGAEGNVSGIEGGHGVARWGADCTFYRYHPAQVFWCDPELIGLSEQAFPDMPLGNEALRMLGEDLPIHNELHVHSIQSVVMSRAHITSFMPFVLPYRTRNPILITSCDAEHSFGILDAHENTTPSIRDALKDHYLKQFCSLFDLQSDQAHTDVPNTIKAITKWFREKYGNTPLKFELAQYDAEMSLAANLNAKLLMLLERTFKRAQPVLTFMIQFLWSVYMGYSKQSRAAWFYILHGKHGGGKTNATIDMVKLLFVPGTYRAVVDRTAKSDTSDDHVDGMISLWDEIPKYYTDTKAADAHTGTIARFKQVWGTGMMLYETLELRRNQYTGASERVNRVVEKPLKEVILAATNHDITPGAHAAIDRFHVEMMKLCETPVSELNYAVSSKEKQAGINLFRMLQSLEAIIEQAMSMGAIVREPSMDAYNLVKPGIQSYLNMIGIPAEPRVFDKVALVIRVEIIKRAVSTVYLFPGGPWNDKIWKPESVRDVERHLYCTEQDIIFGITNQYSEFINEDWRNVIMAFLGLLKLTPKADDDSFDMYQLYQEGHPCMVNLHQVFNTNYSKDDPTRQPRHYANLNHLMLTGSLNDVAKKIAEKTKPRIDAGRVKYILEHLENQMFKPPDPAYVNVNPDVLATHRLVSVPKHKLTSATAMGILSSLGSHVPKNICDDAATAEHFKDIPQVLLDRVDRAFKWEQNELELGLAERFNAAKLNPYAAVITANLIDQGYIWEPGAPESRAYVPIVPVLGRAPLKSDLETTDQAIPMVIIDKTYTGRHKVCIAPCALALTNRQHLIHALEHAIITPTTTPGKRLLGWPDPRDITKFDTLDLSAEYIAAYCDAIGRRDGVYINNRDRRTLAHNAILNPQAEVGVREAGFLWRIPSIDSEAARLHRPRCYKSEDVPFDIQGHALTEYRKKIATLKNHGVANYPDSFLTTEDAKEWEKTKPVRISSANRASLNAKRKRK